MVHTGQPPTGPSRAKGSLDLAIHIPKGEQRVAAPSQLQPHCKFSARGGSVAGAGVRRHSPGGHPGWGVQGALAGHSRSNRKPRGLLPHLGRKLCNSSACASECGGAGWNLGDLSPWDTPNLGFHTPPTATGLPMMPGSP
ncbi:hypothetical protein NN561_011117 [Cricetulus griseus]